LEEQKGGTEPNTTSKFRLGNEFEVDAVFWFSSIIAIRGIRQQSYYIEKRHLLINEPISPAVPPKTKAEYSHLATLSKPELKPPASVAEYRLPHRMDKASYSKGLGQ
jgi:hypothetical protein